ncbi:MAG: hypothetical protein IT576_17750 [Verrucomicrobiales bacterium]|nr:hypothetical protein [Verrucomicrobiales bacterium]
MSTDSCDTARQEVQRTAAAPDHPNAEADGPDVGLCAARGGMVLTRPLLSSSQLCRRK